MSPNEGGSDPLSSEEIILEVWRWEVGLEDDGLRLDHFLNARDTGSSRSQLKKLVDGGYSTVDGQVSRPAKKLKAGQQVELKIPPPEPLSAEPQAMDLDIRFEDEHLVVVNKPQGLVVHPAPGHPSGTLVNGLLFACGAEGGDPLRPGIVHRLDKDTSGLIVVAKNEIAHANLAHQFAEHSVDRRYTVLVAGHPPNRGEWRTLHGRKDGDRKKFSSKVTRGKAAVSLFEVAERFEKASRLLVTLRTGRTHQVRVHCQDHGFPVLGDPWYGPRKLSGAAGEAHSILSGQALHAELLGFDHPATGERLRFESSPPEIFVRALNILRRD